MRTPEEVKKDFVKQWLDKAQDDLRMAEVILAEDFEDYHGAGFHAQQAAEKFVKAFLVFHQIEFPKSHDILVLCKLVAQVDRKLADSLAPADSLTQYGVEFRYPGELPSVSREQAEQALHLSEQVCHLVLSYLPH